MSSHTKGRPHGAPAASAAAAALLALLLWHAGGTSAAPVYDTPALLTGTRSVADPGLATSEPDWQDAQISWAITPNGDGTLTYAYTLVNLNAPAVSHLTLDLSDDAIAGDALADPAAVTDFRINGSPASPLEFGDKDGIAGAVKFDDEDPETTPNLVVYSFVSNRSPVWGDVYLKGGSSSELTNTGFGDRVSEDVLDYVARPNGALPEPGVTSALLLGTAAVAASGGRRRRRDRR